MNVLGGYNMLGRPGLEKLDPQEDQKPSDRGRWYHAGADRTADMLAEVGYTVISKDIGFALRDPILHFRKP